MQSIHEKKDLPAHTAHLRGVAVKHRWSRDTLSTYGTGFNSWVKYCAIIGVDPECRTREGEDWTAEELQGHILQYVIIQCGIRSMDPRSIKDVYLVGINHHFIQQL